VLDAIVAIHVAIEVPQSRLTPRVRRGAPHLLADNACAGSFLFGDAMPFSPGVDLTAQAVRVDRRSGASVHGSGANVMSDPLAALTWLANDLRERQRGIQEGDIVATGSATTPIPVGPGERLVADFGVLGRVAVRFADH
jgi:2-keto-4-pentenoate hydratase